MKPLRHAALRALLLGVYLPVCARAVDFVEGEVVAIADGDTLTVLDRDGRQRRISQVTGWAEASEADAPPQSDGNDEGNRPR